MSQQTFNNQILVEPQAASKFTVGIAPRVNPLATGRVIVIGESEGGAPNIINWFTDKASAKGVLRGGDALREIGYIFNPSPQHDGAPYVGFVRAQVAVQGSVDLTSIIVKSRDYGVYTNDIRVKTENGTLGSTTKKITIIYGDKTEVFDNLGLALDIQYVGSETDGKIEITAGNYIVGTDGGTGVENTDFNFNMAESSYDTISKVAKAIDALDDWTCIANANAPAGSGALSSLYLNTLAAVTCKSSALALQAYPRMCMQALNNESAFVLATYVSDALPDTQVEANLTSGASPSMDNTAIAAALTLIEEANCQIVFLDSETLASQVLVEAHCRTNAYFRMGVCGYASSATKALSITASLAVSQTMNSGHMAGVACGVKDLAEDGSGEETLAPKFFAAKVAGLIAGQPVSQPITRKVFQAQGMQYEYTKDERKQLIQGGVISAKYMDGVGWVITQGVNTLLNNVNLWDPASNASPEISLMRSAGQFEKEITVAADRIFIGGTVGIGRSTIVAFVEGFCDDKVNDGTLAENDSDPDNILPAWENVIATRLASGDGWSVSVSIRLNNPMNFFLFEAVAVL